MPRGRRPGCAATLASLPEPSSRLATLAFISKSLPSAPPDSREEMADSKAALASALTALPPVVRLSPRFLLSYASGAASLRLPVLLSPSSCSPDLLLGGGIPAKFDGWPVVEPSLVQDLWKQWVAKLRPLHEPQPYKAASERPRC
jgi:hypothetical protein